jgi:hypothetical protein
MKYFIAQMNAEGGVRREVFDVWGRLVWNELCPMFDDLRYAQLVRRELERRVMSRGKTLDILLVQEDGRIVPSNTPLDRNPLVSELGAMLGCLATAEARLKGISGCTRDPRTDKE